MPKRICLLSTLLLFAPMATPRPAVPDGVFVRVNGEDLSDGDFFEYVGREAREEQGFEDQLMALLQEIIIDLEAKRQGFQVTEDQLTRRLEQLDREARAAGNREGMEGLLREHEIDEEEFRRRLRKGLLLEQVARATFRIPAGREVPPEKQELWLQDRMRRAAIEIRDLPRDLVARVDGIPVSLSEYGRHLYSGLAKGSPEALELEREYVEVQVVRQFAAGRGIELRRSDIDAAILDRSKTLQRRPGFENIRLDEFMAKIGSSIDWLRTNPRFHAQILLQRLIDESFYPGPELYWFYRSRKPLFDRRYGAAVDVDTIFLRAGQLGAQRTGFVPRLYEDAEVELAALKGRIESGATDFARMARSRSEHDSRDDDGALGWITAAHAEFGALAAHALEQDASSGLFGPVRSGDGVHLFRVNRRRAQPTFTQIRLEVRREACLELLRSLVEAAEVETNR